MAQNEDGLLATETHGRHFLNSLIILTLVELVTFVLWVGFFVFLSFPRIQAFQR